jgi:putative membrane protein
VSAAPWWTWWSWEPGSVAAVASAGALYTIGVTRLWRSAGRGGGIRVAEAACYGLGWLTLAVALLSPIHALGEQLFCVHMSQHELLMLVAAPLLVLGSPMIAFVWALPRRWRAPIGAIAQRPWPRRAWRVVTIPLVAWAIHALALWVWHMPRLFEETLFSEVVHAAQHASFLGSALLFWWALMHDRSALGYGAGVLYLFTTSMHSGLLGALLTVASTSWYPAYALTAPAWGLTAIDDQRLGGLVMWVPASVVYLIAALALMAGWLRDAQRRSAVPAIGISTATVPLQADA